MKIISDRKLRVTTPWGAIAILHPGEPKEMGDEFCRYAIQQGARAYVEGTDDIEEAVFEEVIEEPSVDTELVEALQKLIEEADPNSFKGDGTPKAAVVNKMLGRTVRADDRDAAWEIALNAQVKNMTVSVQSVIDRVQTVLQDTTGVRWPVVGELVLWINDAQREIALLKPDASAVNESVALDDGTKQSIPAGGNRLLRVVRNMSGTGDSATGARAVRLVDREVLDAQTPDWHSNQVTGDATHGTEIKHYIYDEANPRNYYVYPGVDGDAFLEIIYSANPATVDKDDNLSIPDIFANAVMNYVLYMAYMKDAEFAGNSQRASQHWQLFSTSVAGKGQIDAITNPNMERRPTAPTMV